MEFYDVEKKNWRAVPSTGMDTFRLHEGKNNIYGEQIELQIEVRIE